MDMSKGHVHLLEAMLCSLGVMFLDLRVLRWDQNRNWSQVSLKSELPSKEPEICLSNPVWELFFLLKAPR